MSAGKADRFEAVNILDAANIFSKSQEKKMNELSDELQRKKTELTSKEKLRSHALSDAKSIALHANNLKCAQEAREIALQEIKAEVECLQAMDSQDSDLCRSFMESMEIKSQSLAQKFVSAPQQYNIKKISEDIDIDMKEGEDLERTIWNEYEPDIAGSARRMDNEPVIALETSDNFPTQLTANEMKIMICKLMEDIDRLQQRLEKLLSKKQELEREEATL